MSDADDKRGPDDPAPAQAPTHAPASSARQIFRDLGAAGPLAVVSAIFPALGGFALLATIHIVGPWLRSHEALGLALYTSAFALLAGFALLPTYAQAFLGGWAFGFATGSAAAAAGFAGAALIGYALATRLAASDVESALNARPLWRAVRDELVGGGFWKTLGIVTLLRIPFNSPFALTNLALAAARTPVLPYAIGTVAGMLPRTALVVWLAAQVRIEFQGELTKEVVRDARPGWFLPVAVVSVVIVAVIITQLAGRAIKRVAGAQQQDPPSTPPGGTIET